MTDKVQANWYWRNIKTGKEYRVVALANGESTRSGWPVTVVYEDADGMVWARPIEEWLARMERI